MKKTKAHDIDIAGKAIFESRLPSECVHTEYTSYQYGKDYIIELFEGEQSTGVFFHVQLKSSKELPVSKDGTISHSMKIDHLKYYKNVRQPVFLVCVDVTRNSAHFLFLQEYLDQQVSQDVWSRKVTTLSIPYANELSSSAGFIQAVRDAAQYMQNKYPGSVPAAISYQRKQFEEKDNRFRYELGVKDDHLHVVLHAKQPVPFTLNVKGNPQIVEKAVKDLIERGVPIANDQGVELEVRGLPCLESDVLSSFCWQQSIDVGVTISLLRDQSEIAVLPEYRGTLVGGIRERKCGFRQLGNPISVRITLRMNPDARSASLTLVLNWSGEEWVGKSIRRIPYLLPVVKFVGALEECDRFRLRVEHQGYPLICEEEIPDSIRRMGQLKRYVNLVDRCSTIGQHFNFDTQLPAAFSVDDINDVNELFDLAKCGRHEVEHATYNVEFTYTEKVPTAPGKRTDDGVGVFDSQNVEYTFLGYTFTIPRLRVELRGGEFIELGPTDDGSGYRALIRKARQTIILPAESEA